MIGPPAPALTGDQLARWDRRGWLVVPGLLDRATVDELRQAVESVEAAAAGSTAPPTGGVLHHFELTDRGPAIARSERFADDDPVLGRFSRAGPHTAVLARLVGEPVVLFKEKINYKHPGGAGFAPHQDAPAYRFGSRHVSVMVPVDPATRASGCLWFGEGWPRGPLAGDGRGRLSDTVVRQLRWRPVEVGPGDVVCFDAQAPHRSDTNHSDRPRRALYLTYNPASAGDHRQRYYRDKAAEFARQGATFDGARVRLSLNDDFLGRPVVDADHEAPGR